MVQFDQLYWVCIAGYFLNVSFKTMLSLNCAQQHGGDESFSPGIPVDDTSVAAKGCAHENLHVWFFHRCF